MTDMDEERKEKIKIFRVRLDEMSEREQSLKTLDEMKREDEELDKEMREKFRACFNH